MKAVGAMRKGSWWERARELSFAASDLLKSYPNIEELKAAKEAYWLADDAFEKANCFRQVITPGARAKAARYHRQGRKAMDDGHKHWDAAMVRLGIRKIQPNNLGDVK